MFLHFDYRKSEGAELLGGLSGAGLLDDYLPVTTESF